MCEYSQVFEFKLNADDSWISIFSLGFSFELEACILNCSVVFPLGCLLTCQIKPIPNWASILVPTHPHPCLAFLIALPSWLMTISFLLVLKAKILVLALTLFSHIVFSWSIMPVAPTGKIYKEYHFLSSLLPLFRSKLPSCLVWIFAGAS